MSEDRIEAIRRGVNHVAALRAAWDDFYVTGLRAIFGAMEKRAVTAAEVDRWCPFEPIVAIDASAAELEAYVRSRINARKVESSYWWQWTDVREMG